MPGRADTGGSLLWGIVAGVSKREDRTKALALDRMDLLSMWGKDCWTWLTAGDPTNREDPGRPLIWTTDERSVEAPVKPFPVNKPYLRRMIEDLNEYDTCGIDKVRQMIVTTTVLQWMDWTGKFQFGRRMLLNKRTEEEGNTLMEDKIRVVHRRLPDWIQVALPMAPKPAIRIAYHTGSYILSTGENIADSEARGGTCWITFVDESPLQDELDKVTGAIFAMTKKAVLCGTANPHSRGGRVMMKYLNDGKEGWEE